MNPLPARPLHLCFVSSTIYPVLADNGVARVGGAEVQQVLVARALRARGVRVSVLTTDQGVPERSTPEGIEIRHLPPAGRRGWPGLRRIHPRLTDVVAALRRIDPDVVYFRSVGGLLAACAWYARTAGRHLVYAAAHDHDFRAGRIFGLERRELWLYRAGLRASDRILVQNREQLALLRERFGREGLVVPNCYAEAGIVPGRVEGPVLWVGTVKPAKRPELFVELAACLPHRRFVMVGGPAGEDAPAQAYCRAIEARARALPNLSFVGFVPFAEVGGRYDGAAALVNTSEAEGFPNTFLQAWIRGVPTLSFVAPATGHEPSATIACADLPTLTASLDTLLADASAWPDASARVRAHFERRHSVEAVLPLYEQVLRPSDPPGTVGLPSSGRAA
jgi:glycosyltransferase involved in cell wall biosynthesis